MVKVVGYVRRHAAQRPSGNVAESRWRYSLMNWGHDPLNKNRRSSGLPGRGLLRSDVETAGDAGGWVRGMRRGMADYSARTEIDANADTVFDYLSDVDNLPDYFTRMTSAKRGDGEEVHVRADLGDRTVEGTAWLHVDEEDKTLSWGSEGPNDYEGRLVVSERGMGATVRVTLSTARAAGPQIQKGLDDTVSAIKNLCQGGSVPHVLT